MADNVENFRPMEVFWTRDESDDSDTSLVHVPGVNVPGNRRPIKPRMKAQRTPEVKAAIPRRQPIVQDLTPKRKELLQQKENIKPKHQRSASLKDLCPEDKKRVANLVKELAKVGEEKEKAVTQMQEERLHYQRQIAQLEEQHKQILRERESVHKQFEETQNMLAHYQQQVLEQQEKLNNSISEMLTPKKSSTPSRPIHPVDRRQTPRTQIPQQPRAELYTPKGHVYTSPGRLTGEGIDEQRYTPNHRQHSNYQVQPQAMSFNDVDQENYAASHKLYQNGRPMQSSISQLGPDQEMMDFGQGFGQPVQQAYAPQVSQRIEPQQQYYATSRHPYTTFIDHQIAEEKRTLHGGQRVIDSGMHQFPEMQSDYRGGLQKFGPLQEPIASSTQKSDLLRLSQRSGRESGVFHPLAEDSSLRSSLRGSGVQYDVNMREPHFRPNTVQFSEPPAQSVGRQHTPLKSAQGVPSMQEESPISTNFHDHVDDKDFIAYYKKLTPAQRKKELMAQKEALILEQNRLRKILMEQEEQLQTKQKQLHEQQMEQRERLRHFEKTGKFPPRHLSGGESENHQFSRGNQGANYGHESLHGGESRLQDMDVQGDPETEENLHFLEKHGVDVSDMRSRSRARSASRQSIGSPVHGKVSASTSPLRPSQLPQSPLHVDTGTAMTQSARLDARTSPLRPVLLSKQGNLPMHTNRRWTSPQKREGFSPTSDRTMSVIDIIESEEQQTPEKVSRSSTRGRQSTTDMFTESVPMEEDADIEEEESRILEEVFFLR